MTAPATDREAEFQARFAALVITMTQTMAEVLELGRAIGAAQQETPREVPVLRLVHGGEAS